MFFYWVNLFGLLINLLSNNNIINTLFIIFIIYLINKINTFYTNKNYKHYQCHIKKTFIKTTFEVMGYISKSKGFVTQNDINMVTKLIREMNLNKKDTIFVQNAFNNGKKYNYPLVYKLNNLYYLIYNQNNLINQFVSIQIQLSYANNYLDNKTKKILHIIFQELNLSMHNIIMIVNNLNNVNINIRDLFTQNFYEKNTKQKNYNSYDNHTYENRNHYKSDIDKAYELLNVKHSDNLVTIKRAYHKLISKYHPDKLISKGYSPKQLEIAKIKTQEIHKAYHLIKKERQKTI
ncbi:co-chaperone DjlA [Enterobacteriaceae endosymbiont of Donacia tomentosa]|uniref:co-chaperone DjlA n=1 Tax=Enterobacteriaceae endosymbiont of Donacia tomentosa TaxID=2675787 RepID=UPI0014493AF9|nr:co-chaperone DjlA [Enterobacteriaceae endosymbiont of Donacia tomentosa]QJC31611.1 co-chaperone DjlA [Enterobacteriaceae endosymbiont of Donacia tomentosa]